MVDIRDMPILYAAPLVRLRGADPAKRDAPRQPPRDRRQRRGERNDEQTPANDDGHKFDEYI